VSIIRVGLSDTQKFAAGYDAIFRGRRSPKKKKPAAKRKSGATKKKTKGRKK
jgi:hypothetical protein